MMSITKLVFLAVSLAWGIDEADLPAPLRAELQAIRSAADALESDIGRVPKDALQTRAANLDKQIDNFLLDAELLDEDPLAQALKRRHGALGKAIENAAEPTGRPLTEAEKIAQLRAQLDELLAIKPDLENPSFKRDVAPIVAAACVRCHQGNRPAGDFDASTFEGFASGFTPGDPKESHVLQLITGRAEPRMPRGLTAGFPPDWLAVLEAWASKDLPFDGPDAKAPIRQYLIDPNIQRREKLNGLSREELETLQTSIAELHRQLVRSKADFHRFDTEHFLVQTTTSSADAEYIAVLAEATYEQLAEDWEFVSKWSFPRGRWGVQVFADRADFVALAREVEGFRPDATQFAFGRVRPEYGHVALALGQPGETLDSQVAETVAKRILIESTGKLPDWMVHGLARQLASRMEPGVQQGYIEELRQATRLLKGGRKVDDVLGEKLSWSETAPLAAALVAYLDDTKTLKPFLARLLLSGKGRESLDEVLGDKSWEFDTALARWVDRKSRSTRRL